MVFATWRVRRQRCFSRSDRRGRGRRASRRTRTGPPSDTSRQPMARGSFFAHSCIVRRHPVSTTSWNWPRNRDARDLPRRLLALAFRQVPQDAPRTHPIEVHVDAPDDELPQTHPSLFNARLHKEEGAPDLHSYRVAAHEHTYNSIVAMHISMKERRWHGTGGNHHQSGDSF